MAGIRLGMAIAGEEIIEILNKIKYPYNINMLTQQFAAEAIDSNSEKTYRIKEILEERKRLEKELAGFLFVEKVFHSDANFLLVKMKNHREIFEFLKSRKIIVRDRSKQPLCSQCLRITVGTEKENEALLNTLKQYQSLKSNIS
jgi:histidinol-phosphate aminotransferase